MKYNENGIACGLDDIEYLPQLICYQEATDYYQRLNKLPWQEVTWGRRPLPRLVFRYGELEQRMMKQEVLEDLILLVETTLETKVKGLTCNLYRNGRDYLAPKQESLHTSSHTLSLFFGKPRKTVLRSEENERKVQQVEHGDAFYFAPNINRSHFNSVPLERMIKGQTIQVKFFLDKPYLLRERHFRHINILGFGEVPMWFDGPAEQFPEGVTATMMPSSLATSLGYPSNSRSGVINSFQGATEVQAMELLIELGGFGL